MASLSRNKNLATNRRARFDYEILETFEAGMVLTGSEIKSVRQSRVDISEAYVQVRNWLPSRPSVQQASARISQ